MHNVRMGVYCTCPFVWSSESQWVTWPPDRRGTLKQIAQRPTIFTSWLNMHRNVGKMCADQTHENMKSNDCMFLALKVWKWHERPLTSPLGPMLTCTQNCVFSVSIPPNSKVSGTSFHFRPYSANIQSSMLDFKFSHTLMYKPHMWGENCGPLRNLFERTLYSSSLHWSCDSLSVAGQIAKGEFDT